MDDAGGGRRGPRPALSFALIEVVRREYGLSLSNARDIGGSANLNLLTAKDGHQFVVRAYRSHVTAARVNALQRARAVLLDGGIPCAELVFTGDGASFVEAGGNVVEVEGFVDSDAKMDSLDRVDAGLPMLARLHGLLSTLEFEDGLGHPSFTNHVDAVSVVEATRAGTDRMRSWSPTQDERALAGAADRLAADVAEALGQLGHVPAQLVHGDFWDNNVLFRCRRIVMVGDLDFMGKRPRIDDLALTLYFTTYLLEDPLGEEGLRRLKQLVDAYDHGASAPLTATERAVLPLALARQPLWSFAVWAAQLDDEQTARRHLRGHISAVNRALAMVAGLPRVQAALA